MEPKYWLVGLVIGGVVVYYVYHREEVPVTGRKRFMNVTHAWEKKFGVQSFNEVKQQHLKNILPETHPYAVLVKKIGKRIEAVTGHTGFDWEYLVVDSPEVNAFCLPGGKVVVMSGLLQSLQNEAQIAAVLSHEIAHALLRHGVEKLSLSQYLWPIGIFTSVLFDSRKLVDMVMNMLLMLPHSRAVEFEADLIGLFLMARACYDPKEAIAMQSVLETMNHTTTLDSYTSTHPPHHARIEEMNAWLPLAYQERLKFCVRKPKPAQLRHWYDGIPKSAAAAADINS